MKKIFWISLLFSFPVYAENTTIWLPNIPGNVTGTQTSGHNAIDTNITGGTITATNPSVGSTGSAVPASGTYDAGNKGGLLTGLLIGQQTMANSLACVLPSDQSAIPVTAASLPLPSGAATSALQSSMITALGSPFQAGGSIGNTSFGISGTLPDFTSTPTFNLGTLNGAATSALQSTIITDLGNISAQLPATLGQKTMANSLACVFPSDQSAIPSSQSGTWNINNISGAISLPTGAATSANQATANTSLATIATNTGKAPINTTGSGSAAGATVSTVVTLSAPANAVGFVLMSLDTSTANIRWAVGRTATTTLGQQLQPGRDTGFVPVGANVSIIAESGTQNYDIQWVSQ